VLYKLTQLKGCRLLMMAIENELIALWQQILVKEYINGGDFWQ